MLAHNQIATVMEDRGVAMGGAGMGYDGAVASNAFQRAQGTGGGGAIKTGHDVVQSQSQCRAFCEEGIDGEASRMAVGSTQAGAWRNLLRKCAKVPPDGDADPGSIN